MAYIELFGLAPWASITLSCMFTMKCPVRERRQHGVFVKLIDIQGIQVCIKDEPRPAPFSTFSVSLLTFEDLLRNVSMKLHSNSDVFIVDMVSFAQFADFISIDSSFKYDSCHAVALGSQWQWAWFWWFAGQKTSVKVKPGLNLVEMLFQNQHLWTILQSISGPITANYHNHIYLCVSIATSTLKVVKDNEGWEHGWALIK